MASAARTNLTGKVGAWSEAHALIVLLIIEYGLLVLLGRRGRGGREA